MSGLAWTGAIRWLGQLASWAITILVARLLTPADYGLVGMATVFLGFTQLLCEGGLNASLLRRRDEDPVAQAQLGGFAALVGVACALLSFLIAPMLARAYHAPAVAAIVSVGGLGFIPRGAQVVPRALLARRLDFRRLAMIDGLEALSLSISTLLLALGGAGVWSLVYGNLVGVLVAATATFLWCPQRITWPADLRAIASDVVFGGKVLSGQLAWYFYNNSDFAVVGRMLGPQALGAYTIGWTLANAPVDRVAGLVNRVTPAFIAAMSRDRAELRRYLRSLSQGLATLTFPACLGLALVADDLVATLLGPRWAGAVLPLQLLAVAATLRAALVLVSPILVFTGAVERNLRFNVTCAITLPLAFIVASRWGIVGVAGAWIVVYPALATMLLLRDALRAVELSLLGYLRSFTAPAMATALMSLAVVGARTAGILPTPGWERLMLESAVGALVYLIAIMLFAGDQIRATIGLFRAGAPSAAAPPEGGTPRLLVVNYHFAPDPSVGGIRWQQLSRLAMERGWAVDVIALDPVHLKRQDLERLEDLPPGLGLHRVGLPRLPLARLPDRLWERFTRRPSIPGPAQAPAPAPAPVPMQGSKSAAEILTGPRTLRDLPRTYFGWLDRHQGDRWGRAVAKRARELMRTGRFDAIVSCGPPHPPHRSIAEFAAAERIPFILDLRDPWSFLQRLPEAVASPIWLALAARDESWTVKSAALVLTSSEAHSDLLRTRYPARRDSILTIRNGSDEDPLPAHRARPRFTIAYSGSVYLDRDPTPLFRAAARVIRELGLTPEDFGLEFIGEVANHDGVPLETLATREGIAPYYRGQLPRSRRAVFELLAEMSMLVLLQQDSDLAIPAKLYEYIRFNAWVLALATPTSATGKVLQGTGADLVAPEDVDGIAATIRARVMEFRAGVVPQPIARDPRFPRRAQADRLFAAIESLLPSARRTRLRSDDGQPAPHRFEEEGGAVAAPFDLPAIVRGRPPEEVTEDRQPRRGVVTEVEGALRAK